MVKGPLPVNVGGVGAAGGVGQLLFLRLIQKLEHALGSSSHALQHIGHLRKLLDGLGKVFDILDKSLNITNGDDAVCGKNAAHDSHCHIAQVAHKVHDGHHQAGEELALPCGFVQFIVGGVEVCQYHGLPVEGLDHVMTGVDLLNLTVDHAQRGLLRFEVLLAELDHHQHQRQRYRQDQQSDQGHAGTDGKHHHQHTDHGGHAGDQLGDALVQALTQRVHIVGDAGEHLAHGALFKVRQRQAVDLFTDLATEVVADLLRKAGHQPALNKAEGAAQQVHPQQKQQNAADIHKIDAAGATQPGDPAGGKGGGGLCQHLGACNVEDGRKNCKQHGCRKGQLVVAHSADELPQRAFKVLGALGSGTSGSGHITHPPFLYSGYPAQAPSGSAGCGRSPDIPGS